MDDAQNHASPTAGRRASLLWGAAWLIIFGLALFWRAQNLDTLGLSNDEGAYLMWGRLVADGYRLYSETVAVQTPLFLEAVAAAFRLAGPALPVGRWAMLAGFAPLAVSLSWLAYRSGRWPAAVTALLLLSLSPLVFGLSRQVMAEVPATALAVSSLALLVQHARRPKKLWPVASGLLFGLSLIFKAVNPFVALPAALLLLAVHSPGHRLTSPQKNWRNLLLDGALWGAAAILPVAAVFVLYDPAAAFDQLVTFRTDLRTAIPGSWPDTWAQFSLFFWANWGFGLLALGGIISNTLNRRRNSALKRLLFAVNVAWLLGGAGMLLWHAPLFPHHFVALLPPLILLGADFVAAGVAAWRNHEPAVRRWGFVALAAPALFGLWPMVQANQATLAARTGGREQDALKLLSAVTAPTDFVMGDSQLLIFAADRRTPPPLGDVALVGIKAGRQTSERMAQITQDFRAPAVVQWALRLPWLPNYLEWVGQNYLARKVWDNDHIIYFVRRIPPGEPLPNPQQSRLGDSLALRGYSAERAGDDVWLKLYWQTDAPPTEDYTVFVQLLDSSGAYAAGQDSRPLGGYFPTNQWPAGEIITDVARLPLPPDLPPGRYTLITGMYQLDTLERLPVNGGPQDFVTLGQIDIE